MHFIDIVRIGVEAAAVIAFAMSGLIAAARKQLDVVGAFVVAGLTAFGGGTLRDILLDRRPFFWVEHSTWLWVLLALCSGAMMLMHGRHIAPTERAMQWPDALGLGLFTATGTQLALTQQMPMLVAVLLGVVTATFGGVLRDIVCNEIPSLFRDRRPYAVCAFIGGWTAVAAHAWGASELAVLLLGSIVTTLLRMVSLWSGFTLPSWQQRDDASP
ncbi:trimeric intracellular cation channel family protein [Variovorax sp. VNK109]|uniref:trimeric intracellular cation channel family protein n=1 Tax=Variovorax sp. VNK109 TaxID=3400919 RepID=UPI003C11BC17